MTFDSADEVLARPARERRTDRSRPRPSPPPTTRQQQHSATIDQVLDHSFPASDPPSWTGAISRGVATPVANQSNQRLIRQVRAEFLEMPGLCLTRAQAQRLWSLDPPTCEALLNSLIDSRFLRRTARGLFVLCRPGG
jgi:hypothetical protein